jgi:hypothetical protein
MVVAPAGEGSEMPLRRRELMPTNCDGAAKMGTRGIFVMASRTILH